MRGEEGREVGKKSEEGCCPGVVFDKEYEFYKSFPGDMRGEQVQLEWVGNLEQNCQ